MSTKSEKIYAHLKAISDVDAAKEALKIAEENLKNTEGDIMSDDQLSKILLETGVTTISQFICIEGDSVIVSDIEKIPAIYELDGE